MAIRYRTNADQAIDEARRAQAKLYEAKIGSLTDFFPAKQVLNRPGRKPSDNPKQLLSLRLDPEVIEFFRATGDGWQTRMNEALRKAAGLSGP